MLQDRNNFDYLSSNYDPGNATVSNVLAEENVWGFGQVFAVSLLLLPLLSFSEAVYGGSPFPYPSVLFLYDGLTQKLLQTTSFHKTINRKQYLLPRRLYQYPAIPRTTLLDDATNIPGFAE